MFSKHVILTFKRQWIKFILLGSLMVLSSFIYTVFSLTVFAIQSGADNFFKDYKQENFMVEFTPYLTEGELPEALEGCTTTALFLDEIYHEDPACFNQIYADRIAHLDSLLLNVILEQRRYKDTYIDQPGESHRIRILHDAETINLSRVEGKTPTENDEIAISKNYANAHSLEIGHTIYILDDMYTIVGFVLFPDYNLPVIDHNFLIDSVYQTLGLMTNQAFADLTVTERGYVSGLFTTSQNTATLEKQISAHQIPFPDYIQNATLTVNNLRSGAIYAEIEGGQAAGLFFSVMIAIIGIMIIVIMIHKMIERERTTIGILKALGLSSKEMIVPYLWLIAIFSLTFLTLGFLIGIFAAPSFQELFLSFYLLPKEAIGLRLIDAIIAIMIPLIVVLAIAWFRLQRMLGQRPLELMKPKLMVKGQKWFTKFNRFLKWFDITTRVQIGLMYRQMIKVIVYAFGIYFAISLIFLSLGMRNVFSMTLAHYYDTTDFSSIAYCVDWSACEVGDHDKVIETKLMINEYHIDVVAIESENHTHPLQDRKNNDLLPLLKEGIIITESFQDMSRLSIGDVVTIKVAQKTQEVEIVGVADLYLGAYVFIERSMVGELLYNDRDYFNALYATEPLDATTYDIVIHVENLLNQLEYTHSIMQSMFNVILVVSLLMGAVIIYILTGLSIEEQAYEISVFRVLGYPEESIGKMLLGGYFKLNVILFIVTIPSMMLSYYILRALMIDMYDFFIPLKVFPADILYAGLLCWLIFMLSSITAKRKIHAHELQEALKIFQV